MRGGFFESLETILLALIVFLVLQASAQNFRVEGTSMDPTLTHGQYLLVNKVIYEPIPARSDQTAADQRWLYPMRAPQQGDVIVFYEPDQGRDFVKRVIGVPGDLVEIRAGVVYVNGTVLQEPYMVKLDRGNHPPEVVQQGCYFVLGDNRSVSYDSRELGPIPQENIVGKTWFIYWPLSDIDVLGAGLPLFR